MSPVAINGVDNQSVAVNGVQVSQSLSAASETVNAGYYAATTLSAVDGDLATGNIKSGVTIFGKAGSGDVRDISDADLVTGEAPTGKTFYAVSGAKRTGDGTKTLSAASETVNAGYYAATTLSAVDADLAAAKILTGNTIFGFAGTVTAQGTETVSKYANASLNDGQTYTPGDSGIFFKGGPQGSFAPQYYSNGASAWYYVGTVIKHFGFTAISDGTNFRIRMDSGGPREYILFRHHISTWTYERARDEDLAGGATWTTAEKGFFAQGVEQRLGAPGVGFQLQMDTAGWAKAGEYTTALDQPTTILIGDGTNLRVKNDAGGAYYHTTLRAGLN